MSEFIDDVSDGQLKLAAKIKLALVVKSKATFEKHVISGEIIEIIKKNWH